MKGSRSPEKWGSRKAGYPEKSTLAVRPGRPQEEEHVAGCPDFRIRSQPDWDLVQRGGSGGSGGQMRSLGTTGTESEDLRVHWEDPGL